MLSLLKLRNTKIQQIYKHGKFSIIAQPDSTNIRDMRKTFVIISDYNSS